VTTLTHESAGRRRRRRLRRLRRTALVLTLLVACGVTAGYAAWHDEEPDEPLVASGRGTARAVAPHATPAAAAPTSGFPRGTSGFAPVVTDRIPAPTRSIALTAPVPGLTNMQPAARRAFEKSFAAARRTGLSPEVRSAWRSEAWQQVLFDRAVTRYGSRTAASRWVLSPSDSAHVKGYAVDVHPQAAASWLEDHGAAYGVCRTYDNEWWHFEYVASATCPARLPSAAG